MSRTSAYRLRVRTDSDDDNALILLADGELVAILIELSDEGHGEQRGTWAVETVFGLRNGRVPDNNFASAGDAAKWVSEHITHIPFVLDKDVAELG